MMGVLDVPLNAETNTVDKIESRSEKPKIPAYRKNAVSMIKKHHRTQRKKEMMFSD